MTGMQDWQLCQLQEKAKADVALAQKMANDCVNILQITPHLYQEEGIMGWTILFEYHFQGPTTDEEAHLAIPKSGGWRKYAIEWPGGIPGISADLAAGVEYCYTLARELRTKLGQGE